VPDTLEVASGSNIFSNDLFRAGLYFAQDLAGVISTYAVGAGAGSRVIDLCAAPGGKSFGLYLASPGVEIVATDLNTAKIDVMRRSASQLGIPLTAVKRDSTLCREEELETYDFAICDVPCSGLGALRRKPEISYRLTKAHIAGLAETQLKIAQAAFAYLKRGGVMLYSTCTIGKRENDRVIEKLLAANRKAVMDPITLPFALACEHPEMADGLLRLDPVHDMSDGFFMARIKKG
jgi:16S rRNA (cytosine967-C5)-methyltransferase